MAQSTQRPVLLVQGQGEEPRLEFSAPLLELGPVLPYSTGEEGAVQVRNPCPFPVEFYSLEYDTQYLEEEKVSSPETHLSHRREREREITE